MDLHPNILIAAQIFKLTRFARGIFIFPKGFRIVLIYSLLQSSHTSLALRSSDLTDAHKSVFLFLPFWKNLEFPLFVGGGSGADRRSSDRDGECCIDDGIIGIWLFLSWIIQNTFRVTFSSYLRIYCRNYPRFLSDMACVLVYNSALRFEL